MSNLNQLADQARNFAAQLQWLLELPAALDKIGSVQQAADETDKRLAQARADAAEAEADLAEVQQEVVDAKAARDTQIANTQDAVGKLLAEASEAISADAESARLQAAAEIALSREAAAGIVAQARSMADGIIADCAEAKAGATLARDAVEAAKAELEDIQTRLTEARAQVQRMLG